MSGQRLHVSVVIATPTGPLELENPAGGYEIGKDSFARSSRSWRKQEISNEYTEGTYVNRAVLENVVEPLSVYVSGDTQFEFQERMRRLVDAFGQLQYTISRLIGDHEEVWACTVADYTVETSQEFLFATIGRVDAQVPRLPTSVSNQVTGP